MEYFDINFDKNYGVNNGAKLVKIFFEKKIHRNKKSCIFATSFHER